MSGFAWSAVLSPWLSADGDLVAFGEHAFGLLDQDADVERALPLFGQQVALGGRTLGQDADGGDVGHRLPGGLSVGVQGVSGGEQVQRADVWSPACSVMRDLIRAARPAAPIDGNTSSSPVAGPPGRRLHRVTGGHAGTVAARLTAAPRSLLVPVVRGRVFEGLGDSGVAQQHLRQSGDPQQLVHPGRGPG